MPTLDEAALRTPGFVGGAEVELLDGQVWAFPQPYKVFRPDPTDPDGVAEDWSIPGYAEMVRAIFDAQTDLEVVRAEFAALRFLLALNYALTPADFAGLVQLTYSPAAPPDVAEFGETLREVIFGRSRPKGRGGDGPP